MNNLEGPCDLHIHSHFSDGDLSPRDIVRQAHAAGLSAVSVVDHDTLLGQGEAIEAGKDLGVEVLSGLEFSVRVRGFSIHVLGYLFDPDDADLVASAGWLGSARLERARSMALKLTAMGLAVSAEEVISEAGRGTVGRPHFARILLKKGLVSEIQEAFDRYIGDSAPAFVPKAVLPLERIIGLIDGAGGVAVWGHPGEMIRRKAMLEHLRAAGIRGIEVWHPNHTAAVRRKIDSAASKARLVRTGGSDFHFEQAMKAAIGGVSAPYESVLALRRAAGRK